ncbi:PIN2/TERF1-interacting telomerase inhibitor 1 isoform X2 [Diceros bicornis minor]|nr:PIN2/TERF1-interacting telomerase inhibitor 1 isoform X2 [Diceros bicornis minor]
MSMLAERRRKQKWAVDPRNTAWSNDDSKFGQRMLEKMGWSKGKGLGAQEQGATEHIKVQVKNNHLGLGATINNEDNWIAHQDDFNQLLAELNTCHGQETADSSDNKEKKSFSLEEKSKISKNRVHYMKFTKDQIQSKACNNPGFSIYLSELCLRIKISDTRTHHQNFRNTCTCSGKDLSSRSKTDLDCIFGKRQSKKTPEDDSSPTTPDGNETSTTKTSAFTIQDYFAKRMAELKNKPQVTASGPDLSVTQMEGKRGKKIEKEAKDKNVENYTQPQAKKKKDQVERQLGAPCWGENSDTSAEDREDCVWPPDDQDIPPNETSTTKTSAFTIQDYFAKQMAGLKNKPQVTAAGPDLSVTQMEGKRGKKREKEAKDKNMENDTQPKGKKKRDQVERQLGAPCWGENSDTSAEDREDCVWPPDDQDIPRKPKKKREKKKLQKQVEAGVDATLDETPVKKKKKKKKGSK